MRLDKGAAIDKAFASPIDLEPGSGPIAPEDQELLTVTRTLGAHLSLNLVVLPSYASDEDAATMKSKSVRGNIDKRVDVELLRGEIPGADECLESTCSARVRRGLHAAFRTRSSDRAEASRP